MVLVTPYEGDKTKRPMPSLRRRLPNERIGREDSLTSR